MEDKITLMMRMINQILTYLKELLSLINGDHIYRISLRFFVDLGLVNSPVKFETKINFTRETNLHQLFEINAKSGTIRDTDVEIICSEAPYIS